MKIRNWFWGLFFIGSAILIVVNQLGYLTNISLLSLILTLLLIPIIIKSIPYGNFSGILFPIALLCIIYAEPLGITDLTPWPVLATALFGSIGLHILFGKSKRYVHFIKHEREENFKEVIDIPDNNVVDIRANLGGSIKYVNSEQLQKANLTCSLGALKVYFDRAKLHENGAEIHLDISLSGVELYIPRTWKIVNNVDISLGSIEEKYNRSEYSDGPVVMLTGRVSLSGVEIIYV